VEWDPNHSEVVDENLLQRELSVPIMEISILTKRKCDLPDCDVQQWLSMYPGTTGDITTLLGLEQSTNVNNLITLHHDPFMFHQANLRKAGANLTTVNGTPGNFSLLQMWVETIVAEYAQL
jgi:hypothetical protein